MPSESRVIMGILTALKARRKGAVTKHRPVSVIDIEQQGYGKYLATVQYDTGVNAWEESVLFRVEPTVEGKWAVTITDNDFPADRCHNILLEPSMDMPSFVTVYILSGRW